MAELGGVFQVRFSILMATRNRRQFLPDAIASVLAQTFTDWELLICADGDDVSDLIPEDPRIRHFRQEGSCLVDALNQMRSLATGDILHVAEDDDMMSPDALAIVSQNPMRWLYGQMRTTSGELRGTPCFLLGDLLHANYIPCPTVYWTREIGDAVGPFDPACNYAWDYDYWLRLMSIATPMYTPRVLATYRLHPEQLTNTVAGTVPIHAAIARAKHVA